MADCPCTHIPTASSVTVNSDAVTYNGAATCTGFSRTTLNDFITHISNEVCDINAALAALTVDAEDVTLTGIVGTTCVPTAGFTNLAEWLSAVEAYLCAVDAALTGLTVTDVGGTFNISCLGGSATASLQATVQALITKLCSFNSGQAVLELLDSEGSLALPLLPFAKDIVTITDISALGVAKVNIDATDYWINASAISMPGTNVTLVDSQDNYIFIDKDTQLYDVAPVAIGGATPTTNGNKVAMVRTGVGTVTSITQLISNSPFDSDLLEDNSIGADKLTTTICTTPLENDGTNIKLNYDSDDFDISAGNLILKSGCIDGTGYIDIANTFEASIELNGGTNKLQVGVEDSIELDAVTGLVQLVGDSAAPGNLQIYGTDSAGNKGYQSFGDYCYTEIRITPTAGVGTVTYNLDPDLSGVIDYVVEYPTAADKAISINLGTISNAYAGARGKRIRIFLSGIDVDTFTDPTRFSVDFTINAGIPTGYSTTPLSGIYDGVTTRNFISKVSGLAVPSAANNQYLMVKQCEEFIPNYDLTSLTTGMRRIGKYNVLYVYDGAVTVTNETDNYIFN